MLTVWQTAEEMLKADGPDWQKVLAYVESIFRHFEMWRRFLSSCTPAWLFSIVVTGAERLKHCSPQEGAWLIMNSAILDFMTWFYVSIRCPSHRNEGLPTPRWKKLHLGSIFIFLHTIFSDPNTCWVMMYKTQKESVQDRSPEYKHLLNNYFHIWCWVHWFCTVCLFKKNNNNEHFDKTYVVFFKWMISESGAP